MRRKAGTGARGSPPSSSWVWSHTAGGRQALAPFAFVSNLAGCLMVVDLLRSQSTDSAPTNYLQLDPWRPPTPVRRLKLRRQGCEFCGDKELTSAFASVGVFRPCDLDLWDANQPPKNRLRNVIFVLH